MKSKSKTLKTSQQLLTLVGNNNFTNLTNCVNRIRFLITDKNLVEEETIKNLAIVKGVVWKGSELQIIVGTIAIKIKEEIERLQQAKNTDFKLQSTPTDQEQKSFWQRFVSAINGIVIPVLPVILIGAITGTIYAILVATNTIQSGPDLTQGGRFVTDMKLIDGLLYILNNSMFMFLGIFICYSTVKYFGGQPILGILLGLLISSRFFLTQFNADGVLENGDWILFKIEGFPIKIQSYSRSFLPAIGAGILYIYIDKMVKKVSPKSFDTFIRPFVSISLAFFIAFFGILPVLGLLELGIVEMMKWFYEIKYGIGGFFIGFFFQPLVLTGIGWPVWILMEMPWFYGELPLRVFIIFSASTLAMIGTMSAIYFKQTQNSERVKNLTSIKALTLLGVSEPAVYGLLIRKPKAFWLHNLGAGVIGLLLANFMITKDNIGLPGILWIIGHGADWKTILYYLGFVGLGITITFFFVSFFYHEKKSEVVLIKRAARFLAIHTWTANHKMIKVKPPCFLKAEFNPIVKQIKDLNEENKAYYDEYFTYKKNFNKLEKINQKFQAKEVDLLKKMDQGVSVDRLAKLETKLTTLKTKQLVYNELNDRVVKQKEILDLNAAKLQELNEQNFVQINRELNNFFNRYEVSLTNQNEFKNLVWNAVNNNLIVSEHLTKKEVAISKAEFYQTQSKFWTKILPKLV